MNSLDLIVGKTYSIRKPAHWFRRQPKPVIGTCISNRPPKFRIDDDVMVYSDFIFEKLEVTLVPDPPPKKPKPTKKEMCLAATTAEQRKRHARMLKASKQTH